MGFGGFFLQVSQPPFSDPPVTAQTAARRIGWITQRRTGSTRTSFFFLPSSGRPGRVQREPREGSEEEHAALSDTKPQKNACNILQ